MVTQWRDLQMRRLNEINITRIAFVDKGANKKDFALFKRFEEKKNDFKNHKNGDNKNMKPINKYFKAEAVDVSKVDVDTMDEVIGFLTGLEDPDAKKVAELLAAVKTKYADKMNATPKMGPEAMAEAAEEVKKDMETKKFSKAFIDSIKEGVDNMINLFKAIKEVKEDPEAVKKFEEENRELTESEIISGLTK